MLAGVGSHGQRVVGDFVLDRSPGRHFQHIGTGEVGAFDDRLQIPVDRGLVRDRQTLGFLGADRSDDAGHVLGRRQLGTCASKG